MTASTWGRILDPAWPVGGLVAEADGETVGFALYVVHPLTWSERPLCYLEDLYVSPSARGQRIGERLIRHLVELARSEGWARVYWHTREDNATARRLYDRFCPADGFIRYTIRLEAAAETAGG